MLRHKVDQIVERAALAVGYCRNLSERDVARTRRVVFVCTGNICRSPLAQALTEKHGISAVSCGARTKDDLQPTRWRLPKPLKGVSM